MAAACDELGANGIIELQRSDNTRSKGISDAGEVWHRQRSQGEDARGFASYHAQDVEAVLYDHGLYLEFGAIDDRDETMKSITAVEAQGLRTKWDGDLDTRIPV